MKHAFRIALTVVVTVVGYLVNAALTSAQTPMLNSLAVQQVQNSDAAFVAAHTGFAVLGHIGLLVFAVYVIVLLVIWLPVVLRKKRDDQ
jgi:membrane-anchored protein YejM (alkaline phosphatase superfamily)